MMPVGLFLYFLEVLLCCSVSIQGQIPNIEGDLISRLLTGYVANARPIRSGSEMVDATIHLVPNSFTLSDLDQTFQMQLYTLSSWMDYRLEWNTSEFGGLNTTSVAVEDIWTLSPVALSQLEADVDEGGIWIEYTGAVARMQIWDVTVPCLMNINKYPFDKQTCILEMIAKNYFMGEINLTTSGVNHSILKDNPAWLITHLSAGERTLTDKGQKAAQLIINVQRKMVYHWLVSILPILFLDNLMNFCFFIPCDSGEKIGYTASIQLTLFVFFLALVERIPPSNDSIALLNAVVLVLMFKMALCLLANMVILHLHFKTHMGPPPDWLLKILFLTNKVADSQNTEPSFSLTAIQGMHASLGLAVDMSDPKSQWKAVVVALQRQLFWFFCACSFVVFLTLIGYTV